MQIQLKIFHFLHGKMSVNSHGSKEDLGIVN